MSYGSNNLPIIVQRAEITGGGRRRIRKKKKKNYENITILPLAWVKILIKKPHIKRLIILWPRLLNSGQWVQEQLKFQGDLRNELKKEREDKKIYLSNYWKSLNIPKDRKKLMKPDYYAFLMACLIGEDLDNCNSWPDVSLKIYNWDGRKNITMLTDDMDCEGLALALSLLDNQCGCSNCIRHAYPVSHKKLYKKEDLKKDFKYPRIALVGCDCINKDVIDTFIQVAEILQNYNQHNDDDFDDYNDNVNRINLIIDEGKLKDNDENIAAMNYAIKFLEDLRKKANDEDNIELTDKIKRDNEFILHINKLKGMVDFLRNKDSYEIDPLHAMITKLIDDDSMDYIEKLNLIDKQPKFKHKQNKNTVIKQILYNQIEKINENVKVPIPDYVEYEDFIDTYYDNRDNIAETLNNLREDIIPERDMDSVWNNLDKNEEKFKKYHNKEMLKKIKTLTDERNNILKKSVGRWTIKWQNCRHKNVPQDIIGLQVCTVYNINKGKIYLKEIYDWSYKFKEWINRAQCIETLINKWRDVNTYLHNRTEE